MEHHEAPIPPIDPLDQEMRAIFAKEAEEEYHITDEALKEKYIQKEIEKFYDAADRLHTTAIEGMTDPLTGLPNRRLFDAKLRDAYAKVATGKYEANLLVLDLDHFKRVNDEEGHSVGDEVLVAAAKQLLGNIRQTDTVARFGGEEFTILLVNPVATLENRRERLNPIVFAGRLKSRMKLAVRAATKGTDHEIENQTASVGMAPLRYNPTGDLTPPDELFDQADAALYQAKNAGRDAVRVYAPGMVNPNKK